MATDVLAPRLLTGAEAVVEAMRQIDPDVVPVYPITPQTPMIEGFAKVVADGRARSEIVNVESEHSAMSAAVASALAGARTFTATSSQGMALMAEVVYIAAGMRAPVVMAVGNRALSAPINIHGDHSDSMLVRDSGAIQLFADSAQEAYDHMLAAPRIAEHPEVLLPVLACQDGFTLTHSAETARLLPDEDVRAFVGEYELPYPLLDIARPTSQGPFAMPDSYFELRHALVRAMERALEVVPDVLAELGVLTGRALGPVEAYRLEGAEHALVLLGSNAGTAREVVDELRARGERVGLLRIVSFRPFPADLVGASLAGVGRVSVLDRSLAPGAVAPLYADVAASLFGSGVELRGHVYGLGGRDLLPADLHDVFAGRAPAFIGLKEAPWPA